MGPREPQGEGKTASNCLGFPLVYHRSSRARLHPRGLFDFLVHVDVALYYRRYHLVTKTETDATHSGSQSRSRDCCSCKFSLGLFVAAKSFARAHLKNIYNPAHSSWTFFYSFSPLFLTLLFPSLKFLWRSKSILGEFTFLCVTTFFWHLIYHSTRL